MIKKKIYILSADDFILYQPTILNLYDFFSDEYDVTIVTFEPAYLGKAKDTTRKIIYIDPKKNKLKFLKVTDLLCNAVLKRINKLFSFCRFRVRLQRSYKASLLHNLIRSFSNDILIAVDPMPLCVAQKVKEKVCFLSLEIVENDPYIKKMDAAKISCVIIQNTERYNYLFPTAKPQVFYIQNAPMLKNCSVYSGERKDLLWAGTITTDFAVLDCVEFINKNQEYKLVLKGASAKGTKELIESKYAGLVASGNIDINTTYFTPPEFTAFISKFKIGFCFYNWDLIQNNFNYQTAPSGKLFMYLAAGVPVIACNIRGFAFINEYKAGILIDDYSPEVILNAVKIIESNYDYYSKNAYNAFENTCFDTNAQQLKDFIQTL